MSFVANFKKLTGSSRGKLPVYHLNLYFNQLFIPSQVSIMQQLEIRKLKSLMKETDLDDNILYFLLLIADSTHDNTQEHVLVKLDIVSEVNYWPVLPVKSVNPVDILCKPVIEKKEEETLSKSIDSGYESLFENDIYSIMNAKVIFFFKNKGYYILSFRDKFNFIRCRF